MSPAYKTLIQKFTLIIGIIAIELGFIGIATAADYLVSDKQEYDLMMPKLKPGDHLILANGVWRNVNLVFEASGTAEKPITLRSETSGQVFISGVSDLKLAGEHLVVKGLVFKDGYSPTRELVSFRKNEKVFGNHIRFTENVIDSFNKPNRQDESGWIVLHGKNNRVDHNHIVGKTNKGPSLIVRLNADQSQENNHLIDHNYFGHRPTLGGNGGETIRIGVSKYSRVNAFTKVAKNYFEHAAGEVEIISNKSERTTITENVFYESKGSVVLRHGGHNVVSRNVFLGNGVAGTGGVRVINNDQQVFENYFEGLRGQKFNNGLTVMNGVPNSPVNRYHQVDGGVIRNNSFYDIAHIGLGVGSDQERSAAPTNTVISDNIITSDNDELVGVFDDISGISFTGNVSTKPNAEILKAEISPRLKLERADNGLLYPIVTDKSANATALTNAGAPRDLDPIERHDTGVSWYSKPNRTLGKPSAIRVDNNAYALEQAVNSSANGDTLLLTGTYVLPEPLVVRHGIALKAAPNSKAVIVAASGPAIEILAGANLHLEGIHLQQANTVYPLLFAPGYKYDGQYTLSMKNVTATSLTKESNGPLFSSSANSFADSISIDGLEVDNWKAPVFTLSGKGLNGWYLADELDITNSSFTNISGPLVDFGRDGRDESTFGPLFKFSNSTISNVRNIANLDGIDGFEFINNEITNSGAIKVQQRVLGYPFIMKGNTIKGASEINVIGRDGDVFDFKNK